MVPKSGRARETQAAQYAPWGDDTGRRTASVRRRGPKTMHRSRSMVPKSGRARAHRRSISLGEGVRLRFRRAPKPCRSRSMVSKSGRARAHRRSKELGGDVLPRSGRAPKPCRSRNMVSKSVEQGNATAQYVLGVMYRTGEGVPKNAIHAYAWCNLAAVAIEEGKECRSQAQIDESMTPAEIAEGQALSDKLFQQIQRDN